MSAFGVLFLTFAALIGTGMFFFDPIEEAANWINGKKQSQITEEIQAYIEKNGSDAVLKGCTFVFFLVLTMLYTYVFQPYFAITAILQEIGSRDTAYIMLAIVVAQWGMTIYRMIMTKKKSVTEEEVTVLDDEGQKIKGKIEVDQVVELGNPTLRQLRRIVFALPTFYM